MTTNTKKYYLIEVMECKDRSFYCIDKFITLNSEKYSEKVVKMVGF